MVRSLLLVLRCPRRRRRATLQWCHRSGRMGGIVVMHRRRGVLVALLLLLLRGLRLCECWSLPQQPLQMLRASLHETPVGLRRGKLFFAGVHCRKKAFGLV